MFFVKFILKSHFFSVDSDIGRPVKYIYLKCRCELGAGCGVCPTTEGVLTTTVPVVLSIPGPLAREPLGTGPLRVG